MIEHRQRFFLEVQAIIRDCQFAFQAIILFAKPFVLTLFRRFRSHGSGAAFAQAFNAVLSVLTPPGRELIAVELLSS